MPFACCETNVKTTSGPKLLYGKKKVTNLWISSFLLLAINLKVRLLSLGTLGWSAVWVLEPAVFSLAMGVVPCVGTRQDGPHTCGSTPCWFLCYQQQQRAHGRCPTQSHPKAML